MSLQSTLRTRATPPQVGLILAGGRSRRMGRDKAQLQVSAQTLLELMQAKLRAAGLTQIWVSGPHTGSIPDLQPGLGPLAGIASAVARAADHTQMLVVAVDQPRLSVALLRGLLDAPEAPAVRYEREPLPMILTVDRALRDLLQRCCEAPDSRDRSVFAFQQALSVVCLGAHVDQIAELESVNTAEQWRTFLAEIKSQIDPA